LALDGWRSAVTRQSELDERVVWQGLSAAAYDAAVYGSPLLGPVLDAELRVARGLLMPEAMLVEVGCGTGQFCRRLVGDARRVVGVDISAGMLEELARRAGDSVLLVEGDACRLPCLLSESPGVGGLVGAGIPVVAACVMNTLGIMGEVTRRRVLEQMAVTVGPAGRVLVVVFDGAYFERGVEEFYRVNPGLCGDLSDATVDLTARELVVPSTGYRSHWFAADEVRGLAEEAGLRNVTVEAEGIGLFLVANGC
jgi:SAM-dependent methyltransferase